MHSVNIVYHDFLVSAGHCRSISMLSNQIHALFSLARHPHLGREEIVDFQNRHLRRIVMHAYKNIAYYRKLFDSIRLKPQDIRTVDDLSAIPITSKKDLQTVPLKEQVARGVNAGRLITHKTGGSTGEPMVVRRTWIEERLLQAFRRRAMHQFGQRVTDRIVKIFAFGAEPDNDNQLLQRSLQAIGVYRLAGVECRLPPEEIVRQVNRLNPDVVIGSPGVLQHLCELLGEERGPLIRPRFVAVGGEVLTSLMRHQINQAFGAPVFNMYGSYEFNLLAWECRETGELHTCDDSAILEVLKDGRPSKEGEQGEVVGTTLHSFAMPFIRYRLDDIVTRGTDVCKCGKPFSTIRQVQGRVVDYFLLPMGRVIHPWELSDTIYTAPWIRKYRLVQERVDKIVLQVVPMADAPEQEMNRIKDSVNKVLGGAVEFQIVVVPDIHWESGGKFRVYRSLVTSNGNSSL